MNAALASLSSEQLRRAVAIKEQIEALEKELNALLSGAATAPGGAAAPAGAPARVAPGGRGGRRRLTPEARARLAEAARRRWALAKDAPVTPSAPAAPSATPAAVGAPKRRKISPEGRRRIIEAQKRRWAAWRAARKAQQGKAQQK